MKWENRTKNKGENISLKNTFSKNKEKLQETSDLELLRDVKKVVFKLKFLLFFQKTAPRINHSFVIYSASIYVGGGEKYLNWIPKVFAILLKFLNSFEKYFIPNKFYESYFL